MLLRDLYQNLSHGELRHMFLGLDGSGEIDLNDQARIINFANRGLKRLYTRFVHEKGYVGLEVHKDIRTYKLTNEHAVSNVDPANLETRYILDSADDPFTGEIVKVMSVRNDESEYELDKDLRVNDRDGFPLVKTTSYNTLYLKDPLTDFIEPAETLPVVLTLEYQKLHPHIPNNAVETTEIALLPMLEEALVFFVAGRIFSAMPSESNMLQAQTCFKEYERLCLMTEEDDLVQESSSESDDKLGMRGFV